MGGSSSGAAIGVTVVGVVSIVGLLGLLGRYLGVWSWAWAWIRASREEKVKLCRSERTTSTRSYLFDNDLDWIGLWPRTGSYKRFSNLDDVAMTAEESNRSLDQADLPPQPLRPAPAPPPRMSGWIDSGEGSPSPASSVGGFGAGVETPPEPTRPAPVLDRRDSNRSLTGRIQRRDSSKEMLGPSQQGSPKRSSTNPFRASWVPPDEASETAFITGSSAASIGSSPPVDVPTTTGGFGGRQFAPSVSSSAASENRNVVSTTSGIYGPATSAERYVGSGVSGNVSESSVVNLSQRSDVSGSGVYGENKLVMVSDNPFNSSGGGGSSSSRSIGGTYSYDTAITTTATTNNNQMYGNRTTMNNNADTKIPDLWNSNVVVTASDTRTFTSSNFSRTNQNIPITTGTTTFASGTNDTNTSGSLMYDNTKSGSAVFNSVGAVTAGNENIKVTGSTEYTTIPNSAMYTNISTVGNMAYNTGTSTNTSVVAAYNENRAEDTEYKKEDNKATESQISKVSDGLNSTLTIMSKDSPLTFDPGTSSDEPSTPPNTATYPTIHTPHTPSRLAEVEARVRLLQTQPETSRDTSKDWWPTETSTSSVTVLGNQSSLVGNVSDLNSGSDKEGVSLLHDSAVSERTQQKASDAKEGERPVLSVLTEESDEDASARRVREYIASLSARLRQLPDEDSAPQSSPEYIPRTPPSSANYPSTPPNSAVRTPLQVYTETPPSSAELFPYNTTRSSTTGTPPTSAGFRNMYTSRRASADASPASPGGIFSMGNSRRLSLDTPPSSANLVTATPPNSATSQATFADTPPNSAGYSNTPPGSAGIGGSFDAGMVGGMGGQSLKRAMSCDSVSSDTSVTLGELEDTCGQVTGQLSVQLIYDSDTADLEVVVVEGKDLIGPDPHVAVDSYVRVFLLPDKSTNMQTRVCRRTNNPTYRERFLFALEEEELSARSLAFYMYASDKFTNTLIGEAQLKLTEVDLSSPLSTTIPLTDTGQKGVGYGEIMFSLSYLPTAERLTVVVVKARSLVWCDDKASADPFVKVYVLQNGKKVMKKKTSIKKDTRSPVFNEAMIFSVPAPALHNIQLRVTVAEHSVEGAPMKSVGHVIVGTQATGKALSHWNQMMSALRKPIGMWHPIRR